MPFTKEQKQHWYQVNKIKLNQRKAELRKPKKLGRDTIDQVETEIEKNEVETTKNNLSRVETLPAKKNQVDETVRPEPKKVETPLLTKEKIIREDERFITYAKKYEKYVYYSCADSCWNGKYCSNCSDD